MKGAHISSSLVPFGSPMDSSTTRTILFGPDQLSAVAFARASRRSSVAASTSCPYFGQLPMPRT